MPGGLHCFIRVVRSPLSNAFTPAGDAFAVNADNYVFLIILCPHGCDKRTDQDHLDVPEFYLCDTHFEFF